MRNIGKLFVLDWKRIFKSPFAFLLICALVIIPSLYCWFNVWALWDPYSNTQALKVAVYSADAPTQFAGKKIAIGDELITQLHANKKLGWQFVTSKQAVVDGVQSGKYYAGIVVPRRFSKDLMTFVDGKIQRPKLKYYVNEKINAIAPKITASGTTTLQSTISSQFVDTVAKTLVGVFNQAGVKLDANLPLIRRFASLVTATNAQLPTIRQYLNTISTVQAKLPALKAKLKAANQLVGYLPQVNAAGQKLVAANGYLPLVQDAGRLAVTVKGKLPEVQAAGTQLAAVNAQYDTLAQAVTKAATVTGQGLTVIDQVDGTLPSLTRFGQAAQATVATTKDSVLPKVTQALGVVHTAVDAGLSVIAQANTAWAADLTALNADLAELDAAPDTAAVRAAIATRLTQAAARAANAAATARALAATLTHLKATGQTLQIKDTAALTTAIDRLNRVATTADALETQAKALAQAVPNLSLTDLRSRLTTLATTAGGFAQAATVLANLNLAASVQTVVTHFTAALSAADTTLTQINQQVLPAMPALLANTKDLLRQANTFLKALRHQLPALKTELADADRLLNGHMGQIQSGVTLAAGLYQTEFPALKAKLQRATGFIQSDLPGIERDLTTSLALANAKLPLLESGLQTAAAFKQDDWPTLETAIQKGAAAIKKGERSVDLSALIALLRRDATKEASFLAAPVTVSQTTLYHIPTYGSQSAPFYLALCIWVGALLLGAILMTEYELPAALAHTTVRQRYLARWLTFAGLGMLQALVAAAGNIVLIHTYVVNKPLYLLFAMLLAVVFVSILYALIALFGNVGKGLGIIILVLSISGAGGNFPVVLSGQFFQAINPWLPFTYAVNLLRETVGGIYWPGLWQDLAALAAFGLAFTALGLLLKGPIRPWIDRMHRITRQSKIIE
ncbi:YhgE/Pip domain-containing protein [Lacticaseibacillus parakribbianus]|uniref:YhgE/Pip domain-containing protein n=1 Tax=Lacticaseibacillus parakribbianus TaxID=2970927 RepID=UPI0021CB0528|nr:YhgE/Pip domain-containing protein [Lacticaseibacillus parakribbianus]